MFHFDSTNHARDFIFLSPLLKVPSSVTRSQWDLLSHNLCGRFHIPKPIDLVSECLTPGTLESCSAREEVRASRRPAKGEGLLNFCFPGDGRGWFLVSNLEGEGEDEEVGGAMESIFNKMAGRKRRKKKKVTFSRGKNMGPLSAVGTLFLQSPARLYRAASALDLHGISLSLIYP